MIKKVDISQLVLETKDLYVREFAESDIPALDGYMQDARFQQYVALRFLNAGEAWNTYRSERTEESCVRYYFVVVLKESSNPIGVLRIDVLDVTESLANLHLEMHPDYWGKGYTTQAARAVIEWAFQNIDLKKFRGTAHPANIGSQKVLKRLGFRFVEHRENYFVDHRGQMQERLVYMLESSNS